MAREAGSPTKHSAVRSRPVARSDMYAHTAQNSAVSTPAARHCAPPAHGRRGGTTASWSWHSSVFNMAMPSG
ncbi:hypothetical protein GCM10027168_28760 [Streptomyces capparidis]